MIYNIYPVFIKEIENGIILKGKKEEKIPSSLITNFGEKIVRVAVLGTLIEKFLSSSGNYGFIVLNDESGAIKVKAFREKVLNIVDLEFGDLIFCIGKIKSSEEEKFIVLEICKKVEHNFEKYFKMQIVKRIKNNERIIQYLKDVYSQLDYDELKDYVREHFRYDEIQLDCILKNFGEKKLEEKIINLAKTLDSFDIFQLSALTNISEIDLKKIIEILINEGKIQKVENKYKVI